MVRGLHWQSRMVSGVLKVRIALPFYQPSLEWYGEAGSLAEYRMVSGVSKVRIALSFSQPSLEWDSEGSSLA
jgi:hypothetical protein